MSTFNSQKRFLLYMYCKCVTNFFFTLIGRYLNLDSMRKYYIDEL